ncbi:MAG: precorrin-6A/cobalt-precorrin-6A reductase [Paracoccaceae bacterium]|jgi:precorrin-6A/cobalt-precorrin-6A reductase
MRPTLLVLGGTTEATALAHALNDGGYNAIFSYAGRVAHPKAQPLPTRVGGFGGVDGLVDYLGVHQISHVIDATHPFAAQMSRNAVAACAKVGVKLIALTRPEWSAVPGDHWTHVADMAAAVTALNRAPCRVMLAIGKLNLAGFAVHQQHHYLLRLIDEPTIGLPFTNCDVVVAQGPFEYADDLALMRAHKIDLLVSKNAGGTAARAKIDVARELAIKVVMIDRPKVANLGEVASVAAVLDWIAQFPGRHGNTDRGV